MDTSKGNDSKIKSLLRRVGIVNTALTSLTILIIVIAFILSSIASANVSKALKNAEAHKPNVIYGDEVSETPAAALLDVALVYASMGEAERAEKFVDAFFSKYNSLTNLNSYLKQFIFVDTAQSYDVLPENIEDFLKIVKLISKHYSPNEVFVEFLVTSFDKSYTNSFYHAYKEMLPLVDDHAIEKALDLSESMDLYGAYVLNHAIGEPENIEWCNAHKIVEAKAVKINNGKEISQVYKHYNIYGQLVAINECSGVETFYTEYEYNSDGTVSTEAYYELSVFQNYTPDPIVTKYTYDRNKQVISKTVTDNGVTAQYSYIYDYDDEGRLIEFICRNNENVQSHFKYNYTNDVFPNLCTEKFNQLDHSTTIYTYDIDGSLLSEYTVVSGNQVLSSTSYTYNVFGHTEKAKLTKTGEEIVYTYTCYKNPTEVQP